MNNFSFLAFFLSLIPMFGWGTMDFLGAKVSRKLGELFGLFIFQLTGIFLLLPLIPLFPIQPTAKFILIFLLGIFNLGAWIPFMYAAKVGDISIVGPIGQTGYAITVLLGIVLLHESLTILKFFSILLIFLGVLFLSLNWEAIRKLNPAKIYKGVVWAVFAAFDTGITFFLLAPLVRSTSWFYTSFIFRSAIVISTLVILLLKRAKILPKIKGLPLKLVLGMAFVDTAGFLAYNFAISRFEVSYVSVVVAAAPLVTVTLAYFFLQERLRSLQKFGLLLVLTGLIALQLA